MSTTVGDGSYVGATLARRQFGGVTLAETDYPPGLRVPAHAHSSGLVVLMLDGAMTEHRGRRSVLCEAGSMIFQPPDEEHAHRFLDSGGRCFILQLGDPWIGRMKRLELIEPRTPLALRGGKAVSVVGELRREFHAGDEASELAIEGLALSLLGELARARTRSERSVKPEWLLRAVDLLHDRVGESIQLAEIAVEVGVHPVHLSRTFPEHYGCTMGEYLRRLRVERARADLAESSKPLAAVDFDAGFSDQAHITRIFKRLVGVTPGAYRRETARG